MTPPALARWLVARLVPADDRQLFLGDLDEGFERECARQGIRGARRWYRQQVASSLLPLVRHRLAVAGRPTPTPTGRLDMWTDLLDDVRYAERLARRHAVLSAVMICTVALGVGVTSAVFGVVDAVLLRPLPFPSSDRVVQLQGVVRSGEPFSNLAYPDLIDFRRDVAAFAEVGIYQLSSATLERMNGPEMLNTVEVDDAFQRIFSLTPLVGRLLVPDDLRLGAAPVVVLSYPLWQRAFGGSRSVVGTVVSLDGRSCEIVGVLPPSNFAFPRRDVDALMPLIPQPGTMMVRRGAMWAGAVAMLRAGATLENARVQTTAVAAHIATTFPHSNTGITAGVRPLKEVVVGDVRHMLLLLTLAMAAVLLIVCANVTNLMLSRASSRVREFAVRAALGGPAGRISRQIVAESITLSCLGGALGVLLAPLLTRALVALYPLGLPRAAEIGVDLRVLAVAAVTIMLAGLLASLPTVRYATRPDLNDALRNGARAASGRSRTGGLLIVAQVASSLALIFCAALLVQTFARLTHTDAGFDQRNTVTFRIAAPHVRYDSRAKIDRYFDDLTTSIRAIPGVSVVATTTTLPFSGYSFKDVFVQDELGDRGPNNPQVMIDIVTPGFERAVGMPVIAGRPFLSSDDSLSERVLVVNEALARRYYGGNAVGRIVQWNGQNHWRIMGVVGSTAFDRLDAERPPMLFIPEAQATRTSRFVVVRSTLDPAQLFPAMRERVRRIDPAVPMTELATMEHRLAESLAEQRFRAALIGGLTVLAVILSIIGIYGVVAYAVGRQTREIGIRMALGEDAGQVRVRVLGTALRTAFLGVSAGLLVAWAAGSWLSAVLVGVTPHDPLLLAGATLAALGIAATAAYLPARRASQVDPLVALRAD